MLVPPLLASLVSLSLMVSLAPFDAEAPPASADTLLREAGSRSITSTRTSGRRSRMAAGAVVELKYATLPSPIARRAPASSKSAR